MHYSTDKEHRGLLTRKRRFYAALVALKLVATLALWFTIALVATKRNSSSPPSVQAGTNLGRRLLFIPRYSWPTAPAGPAGCVWPLQSICTVWGTRYPPDIFTAATGSY
mmetsp:Transcript_1600/g.4109  ORF Transcript_1600/g.4109 Transcript_1600/m.4109 type:complete len:109 (+) Transcript_1600:597-923(+)